MAGRHIQLAFKNEAMQGLLARLLNYVADATSNGFENYGSCFRAQRLKNSRLSILQHLNSFIGPSIVSLTHVNLHYHRL